MASSSNACGNSTFCPPPCFARPPPLHVRGKPGGGGGSNGSCSSGSTKSTKPDFWLIPSKPVSGSACPSRNARRQRRASMHGSTVAPSPPMAEPEISTRSTSPAWWMTAPPTITPRYAQRRRASMNAATTTAAAATTSSCNSSMYSLGSGASSSHPGSSSQASGSSTSGDMYSSSNNNSKITKLPGGGSGYDYPVPLTSSMFTSGNNRTSISSNYTNMDNSSSMSRKQWRRASLHASSSQCSPDTSKPNTAGSALMSSFSDHPGRRASLHGTTNTSLFQTPTPTTTPSKTTTAGAAAPTRAQRNVCWMPPPPAVLPRSSGERRSQSKSHSRRNSLTALLGWSSGGGKSGNSSTHHSRSSIMGKASSKSSPTKSSPSLSLPSCSSVDRRDGASGTTGATSRSTSSRPSSVQMQDALLAHLQLLASRLRRNDPSLTHLQPYSAVGYVGGGPATVSAQHEQQRRPRRGSVTGGTTPSPLTSSAAFWNCQGLLPLGGFTVLEQDDVRQALEDCLAACRGNSTVHAVTLQALPPPELSAALQDIANLQHLEQLTVSHAHRSQSLPVNDLIPLLRASKPVPRQRWGLTAINIETRFAFSTQSQLDDLADAVADLTNLKSMSLHLIPRCSIQTPTLYLDALLRACATLPQLQSLTLTAGYDHNPYGRPLVQDADSLCRVLRDAPLLRFVTLDNFGLRDMHFQGIAAALIQNDHLHQLQITRNAHVTTTALQSVAAVLATQNFCLQQCTFLLPTSATTASSLNTEQLGGDIMGGWNANDTSNVMSSVHGVGVGRCLEMTAATPTAAPTSPEGQLQRRWQEQIHIYCRLNVIGRGRLLHWDATSIDWIEAVIQAAADPSTVPDSVLARSLEQALAATRNPQEQAIEDKLALDATYCLLRANPCICEGLPRMMAAEAAAAATDMVEQDLMDFTLDDVVDDAGAAGAGCCSPPPPPVATVAIGSDHSTLVAVAAASASTSTPARSDRQDEEKTDREEEDDEYEISYDMMFQSTQRSLLRPSLNALPPSFSTSFKSLTTASATDEIASAEAWMMNHRPASLTLKSHQQKRTLTQRRQINSVYKQNSSHSLGDSSLASNSTASSRYLLRKKTKRPDLLATMHEQAWMHTPFHGATTAKASTTVTGSPCQGQDFHHRHLSGGGNGAGSGGGGAAAGAAAASDYERMRAPSALSYYRNSSRRSVASISTLGTTGSMRSLGTADAASVGGSTVGGSSTYSLFAAGSLSSAGSSEFSMRSSHRMALPGSKNNGSKRRY